MSGVLRAESLGHAFDYPLFSDLSFALKSGESVAVVGPSGSGKSTLLHILSTFLKPHDGIVYYKEQSLYDLSASELQRIRREEFGIIFQFHYLFRGFSAGENLEVAALLSGQSVDGALLERFGVAHLLAQPVQTLSGGQQQRISIARVLTKKPAVIFADEPTGNLDAQTATEVMEAMGEYLRTSGGVMFVVTHDERLAARCDRRYRLAEGRLLSL